jgi:hypothetical protein
MHGHTWCIAKTKYENTMSLSLRCAARSRRSRALIILVGLHGLIESGMPRLSSCATRVVPERGGKVLELGTDSYTEVVPAPQGGRLW